MSNAMDDRTLLRRYAETGCEEAFAALVARHIDHVYSVAGRETADAHQAEELTQAAFIILARKANRLHPETVLSGWLFQTVRFAARNARRAEQRRQRHEQEAAQMSSPHTEHETETAWEQIAPLLNDALAALGAADRDAITLRFFEKKSHAEIATALRTNEASARKRLSRAVERLRGLLTRRGVAVPVATLLGALTAHSVQAAPSVLAAGLAPAAAGAGASTSTAVLVENTLNLMAWTKLKIAAASAAALLLAGGAAVVVVPLLSTETSLSQTLPDGSTLTLTQREMGTQVTFRYQESENALKTRLRKWLPDSAIKKLGWGRSSGSIGLSSFDGAESLFIGTAHEKRPLQSPINLNRLQVSGDDGSTFDGLFQGGTVGFTHEQLQGWRLYAFPRRCGNLTLRFFYSDPAAAWVMAAEMVIPNPVAGPFPTWTPEPLPLSRTNGDLVVTLTEFEAGAPQNHALGFLTDSWKKLPGTRCVFTLKQTGKAVAPWLVRSIQLSDATGNLWTAGDLVSWAELDPEPRLQTSMLGALWTSEPAWNLRVEFSRTNAFLPDELLMLSKVPVPDADEVIQLNESKLINDVAVDVAVVGGTDAELPSRYKWLRNKGQMNLALSAQIESTGKRLTLVSVRDEQGRAVAFEGKRGSYDRGELVFGFLPESDAQSLDFTFAVHQSRFVEFRAKPKQVAQVAAK